MFGSLGGPEIAIIAVVVVLLFGVGKLSGLGRDLGSSIKEFRRAMKDEDAEKQQAEQQQQQPQVAQTQAQQPQQEQQPAQQPGQQQDVQPQGQSQNNHQSKETEKPNVF
ncbi:MAG: twin-arginine translocase TatA/TatE family subunit [Dehalococcoidia bacterium]|nr:twin-arginine translocase TatA/TatE family subunit [Dehalococcoidia bacterium]